MRQKLRSKENSEQEKSNSEEKDTKQCMQGANMYFKKIKRAPLMF